MRKILTAQIREVIYDYLMSSWLFPEEQKRCHKGTRGTGELLYIDQPVFNESKARWKKLEMVWIDNTKAYYMLPQSWIIHCLKMYNISNEVIRFIEKTMETWRVELTAGGRSLAVVKIQGGIFQKDALWPLLFVIAIIQLNQILRKCTSGYKLTKSQENDQPPNVHERHQIVYKKRKIIRNPNTDCENIP